MKTLALTAGGVLLLVASASTGRPMPSSHSQHHVAAKGRECPSEAKMQQMMGMMQQMMQMMQMHQQMMSGQGMKMPMNGGMKMPMPPANPDQDPPQPEPHQH